MSNICKTVTLRTRPIKHSKMLSFYLDYYPGYRDNATMKVMRHESLGIYIYAKPKNRKEREYNDRLTEKAEVLRCRRYESIVNERYDFFDKEKEKGDFLAYFKELAVKKNTKWEHVYKHFERFSGGKCSFGEINVDLCRRFMEYLLNARQYRHTGRQLHINSVAGYWSTFYYCIDLTSVSIGDGVKTIGESAFYKCSSLTTISLGSGVRTIGESAFYKCSITTISLGSDVKTIGSWAFEDCIALKDFYCFAENIPTTGSDTFDGVNLRSATLHVPAASLEAYSAKSPWKIFGQIVPIGEGDGIEQVNSKEENPTSCYNLSGRRTAKMQKGINLLHDANGHVKKVLRK